jgi:hypothetical protein
MTYRYSEEELADIKKRQATNLANFQRNSGRGLPKETLEHMEKAAGVQMDENGNPVPLPMPPPAFPPAPPPPPVKTKRARKAALPVPTEHEECRWLMDWAETQRFNGWPLSSLLVHVPNGAYHGHDRKAGAVVARKLREQGLQPGAFDYILPVPIWTKKCPGLWLEMKRTKRGEVSTDQEEFRSRMLELGWHCEIAKGWVEASKFITEHLRSATPR